MLVANHSGFPRIGETEALQILRRAIEDVGRGKKSASDLAKAHDEMTTLALREQEEAGCGLATDGQIRWVDPVSHFAGNFEGIEIGSIFRFFDTNFLIRQPTAHAKVRWKGPLTARECAFAVKTAKCQVKAVLTGPVTLARHTILTGGPYQNAADLAADYAEGLLAEAKAVLAEKPSAIQIDEPSILTNTEDLAVLKEFLSAVSKLAEKKVPVFLATYFNDASALYEKLLALPASGFVWDLTYSETLEERLKAGFSKILGLGIADSRNTRLEKPEDLARRIESIAKKARGEIQLLPSASLEYLPRDKAKQKLALLAKTRKYLED